ncbi:MAG: hypothetical protein J5798_08285 [Spirochaetaceae bacterium]|nr:hypothetical protein [Spirochaetaceae bacterium]
MNPQIVIPVAKKNIEILKKNIIYIRKFLNPSNVYILTAKENFSDFEDLKNQLTVLDENEIIKDVTFNTIDGIIEKTSIPAKRTGWYFQQLLKMFWCYYPLCADFYTVWDADTFPLKPIELFSKDGKPYMHTKTENHTAYFETIEKLLNMKKEVDYSFISEKMTFSKKIMQELLNEISNANVDGDSAIEKIIFTADKSSNEFGFSEFETYGTYVHYKYADFYQIQNLKSYRNAARGAGRNPNKYDIALLGRFFDTASFEKWDIPKKWFVPLFKTAAFLSYPLNKNYR